MPQYFDCHVFPYKNACSSLCKPVISYRFMHTRRVVGEWPLDRTMLLVALERNNMHERGSCIVHCDAVRWFSHGNGEHSTR